MRILRWLGIVVAVLVLAVAGLFLGARFADGPIAVVPGGALRSGDWVETPVSDWGFARDENTIELQLESQDTSRTVWILVHEGRAFIPASLSFPPGKTWHRKALSDGSSILRIGGRRYRVTLEKSEEQAVFPALVSEVGRKYGAGPPGSDAENPQVWFFEVTSRSG